MTFFFFFLKTSNKIKCFFHLTIKFFKFEKLKKIALIF